ncbi:MAG TPA: ABC transporter substrate-binding protein, partial [Acidimicrobiales bacterium]|nr:ABC transporter substrate-binding protein [Acidimicrobiales bacterium]
MRLRKAVAISILLAAAVASCGMRGGSNQTIIDGLGPSTAQLTSTNQSSGLAPGTKLTASAPGITPTTINIGTIQDISGPVPGLFQTALEGVKAWVAYENSKGGIDGRRLVLDAYDAGLNPTKFQQYEAQACNSDFALVGVMSTVDNNG